MLRWPSFWWGQRMRWPPRRSMLRLAPPIMIGGDAALARRYAPKGGAAPFYPPGASRGSAGVSEQNASEWSVGGGSDSTSRIGSGGAGSASDTEAKARLEHGAAAGDSWISVRCA